MEKHRLGIKTISSILLSLGLFSFSACIAAEFKRTKMKDLRLAGKLCSLPGSPAFGLGISALISLVVVQIVGNLVVFKQLCSQYRKFSEQARKQSLGIILLVLSWISFSLGIIILGAASSMNRNQPYNKGWVDGECYTVKGGVYIGASALVLTTAFFLIGSTFAIRPSRNLGEQGRRVHAGGWSDERR